MRSPGRDVWLPLCSDDDAWVGVVEAVLRQAHERSVFLHKQYEQRVAHNVGHLPAEQVLH